MTQESQHLNKKREKEKKGIFKIMKKLLLLSTLSLSFVLASCGTEEVEPKEVAEDTISATITITSEDKTVAEKVVVFEEGENLQEVMTETFDVVEEDGFITSLEGLEQSESENKWWTFTANDEMVNVGANEYILEEDDNIDWTLTKF